MATNVMAKTDLYVVGGVIAFLVVILIAANATDRWAEVSVPRTETAALQAGLESQAQALRSIGSRLEALAALKSRVEALEVSRRASESKFTSASFAPTSEGFQPVETSFGMFAVSIEDVVPYGDGTKLTVNIGNPLAADYQGAKLTIQYARKYESGRTDDLERTKERALRKPIRAGPWNPTWIILPGIKPEDMLYLNVKVETNQISLQ